MKKISAFLVLYILGIGCTSLYAQRRASKAAPTIEECLKNYRFEQAESLLQKELSKLKRTRKPTQATELLLNKVERGQGMLEATEQVQFIDSIVVDKKDLLRTIKLSPESGTLHPYTNFFNRKDSLNCTVYLSELENKIYFSQATKDGKIALFTSDKIDGKWTSPMPLSGLNERGEVQSYPFMLSDGMTLYYAAKGEESLGGYDIFVSRYDTETQQYLQPENLGMPYNSPANDYLLVIDEFNQLGWFATDRNQPEGKVCIYVFIPNEVREIYPINEMNEAQLASLARINSITDTQINKTAVAQARVRLQQVRTNLAKPAPKKDFEFIIDNKRTYTVLSDFRSAEAKRAMQDWLRAKKQLTEKQQQLDILRHNYVNSSGNAKTKLTQQILSLEQTCELEREQLKQKTKQIRQLEAKVLQ